MDVDQYCLPELFVILLLSSSIGSLLLLPAAVSLACEVSGCRFNFMAQHSRGRPSHHVPNSIKADSFSLRARSMRIAILSQGNDPSIDHA
ncbi:hypothetical protein BDP55DRAFT_673653 [Colletotrichum godetiae]|uniref:Uncharacterized protein n=1 Tax=Colletotrichum godetiae TaxID=1209918 RepID=A0AAJ0EUL0_9PEZI|nr:uncharacterized protein BDP55DRAFT_673653 [Colletotrichum godetiae]KAK1672355.1 hypothetical protein BDP55DRAFT_673653 [Colletotrichum godetiae]